MKKLFVHTLLLMWTAAANATVPWSVDSCMQYAAEHSHAVRRQQFALDDSRVQHIRAIGAFLPGIYGQVSGQMNFGRAIDPETNTYTDVATLYNGYGLSASLTLFDGLQRYNDLRMARANVAMSRHALRAEKDDAALKVYKAYMDLVYCQGAVGHISMKREDSRLLLHQTEVMAEVGLKSDADVAQMRATLAADDYELASMQGQTTKARLALERLMNFPSDDTLCVQMPEFPATDTAEPCSEQTVAAAMLSYPRLQQARYGVESARYSLRAAHGMLLPTISFSAGVSTSFYRNMDHGGHASFGSQFKNNAGQYLGITLSVPLFNRLSTVSTIRSRHIALCRAAEDMEYQQTEMRRIIIEATTDRDNSMEEVAKMAEQVAADSIAEYLTKRKYEEGLASSADVRTAAVTLLQSRVKLLQSRLTLMYNRRLLEYYNGRDLWKD